jgi:hypothetical protein
MSPGARSLADQLVSAQPGLIPQISGKLTHQCVNGSTIFVDNFSDHVYAYLIRDLTLDETITAKHGYELSFFICLGFNLKHIMLTTVALQIKGSETIACKTTRLSHFVVLEVIIRRCAFFLGEPL